jgi:hypothetical protein
MSQWGVEHKLSTAHHQRTDGQSERKIQEAQVYLRIYVKEYKDWEEWIPLLQYALNNAVSAATKETPFFLVFGRECDEKTPEGNHGDMSAIHAQVVKDLEWNSINMKKYFDNKREDAPSLKEGDRVYLRRTKNATDFNIKTRNDMDKLNCLLLGPYEIKRKLENDNYVPENMRIHPNFPHLVTEAN